MGSPQYGLGRRHAPDPRDQQHPLTVAAPATTLTYKTWPGRTYVLDQGQTSECVAFSWSHFIIDSPTTHTVSAETGNLTVNATVPYHVDDLYHAAQLVDEFPDTPPAGGTSVRAGAKILQSRGLIGAYTWAQSITDIVNCVLTQGPVIVGTDWLENMFHPVWNSTLRRYVLNVSGAVAGGHAWKIDGVNTTLGLARMKNSWGRGWGTDGHAWLKISDLDMLVFQRSGEACRALEPA